MTPSTLTTSDAGAGIGYTTLRVRGTDGTRINITVNGIPMNDAESHNLFWVNMPDFSSSVKDMQVQRGAGTSTNGAGAFGASVNMQTEGASMKPYAEFNGSYGSFNTHKETVKVGTGLLNNHWTFDARLSNIGTDGYIAVSYTHLDIKELKRTTLRVYIFCPGFKTSFSTMSITSRTSFVSNNAVFFNKKYPVSSKTSFRKTISFSNSYESGSAVVSSLLTLRLT